MSYSFSDASRKSVQGPSINGFRNVKALVARSKDLPTPAFGQLIEFGYTNLLSELDKECASLIKRTDDKEIKVTLSALGRFARSAYDRNP